MYFDEVFQTLARSQVRYLVIGGVALVLHGVVRLTGDLDLMIDLKEDNLKTFLKAIEAIGYRPKLPVKARDFASEEIRKKWIKEKNLRVFSFVHSKDDYKIIDVFPENPIPFMKAYHQRQKVKAGNVNIDVISVKDLITLKKMSARPQDLQDIEMIRELRKNEQ